MPFPKLRVRFCACGPGMSRTVAWGEVLPPLAAVTAACARAMVLKGAEGAVPAAPSLPCGETKKVGSSRSILLTHSVMKVKVVALDFDGVICDSAGETGQSGWRACLALRPGATAAVSAEEHLQLFAAARPFLETGFEAVPIMWVLREGAAALERLLADFAPVLAAAQHELGGDLAALKAAFKQAREGWIETDCDGWLASHRFYPEATAAAAALVAEAEGGGGDVAVYVITTKGKEFALRLLGAAGVGVPPDRVFGLGSGPKGGVLAQIVEAHGGEGAVHGFFVEDRADTLAAVQAAHPATAARFELVLADWGYNTPAQRAAAAEGGCTVVAQQELAGTLRRAPNL